VTNTLETLSWIAAVVAIPVAVIGWFVATGKKKINKSVASRDGIATSGDVRVDGRAGFVTGHNSPMNVSLTVGGSGNESYSKREAVFKATRKLIDEAPTRKRFSDETIHDFVTSVRDAPLLFDDDGLIEIPEPDTTPRYKPPSYRYDDGGAAIGASKGWRC
jgi:hypothetical protein